jgi:hypothetical protein
MGVPTLFSSLLALGMEGGRGRGTTVAMAAVVDRSGGRSSYVSFVYLRPAEAEMGRTIEWHKRVQVGCGVRCVPDHEVT